MLKHSTLLALFWVTEVASISSKKGLCVSPNNFQCQDMQLFPNISWFYNWGTEFVGSSCPSPPPGFVPMVVGFWGNVPQNFTGETILGFNEPDHDEHPLTPEKAVEGWLQLQETYYDRTLVSPATSLKPDGEMVWLDEFLALCEDLGCRIDYIAVHVYQRNPGHIMEMLGDLYTRHGKKIWLTEFAMSNTNQPEKALEFMQELLPLLEAEEG